MSDHDPLPETHPLPQLEQLVRHLGEELAMFRKRAIQAETKLKAFDSSTRPGDLFTEQRAAQLARENTDLGRGSTSPRSARGGPGPGAVPAPAGGCPIGSGLAVGSRR